MRASTYSSDWLTYQIIGLAMKAHAELGPGLDEICYHEALSSKMGSTAVEHAFKPRQVLLHRGYVADQFEADIIIPDRAVLEVKRLRGSVAPEHLAQLHCYMKAWQIETGLLLDFGKQTLHVRRRIASHPDVPPSIEDLRTLLHRQGLGKADADLLGGCLHRILAQHGLGYWETTYRGLIRADLQAEGIELMVHPEVLVEIGPGCSRAAQLDCLVVVGRLVLLVLGLYSSVPAAAKAILRSYLRHLGLQAGVVINFGKQRLDLHSEHL